MATLNSKEKAVMKAVYTAVGSKNSAILSIDEIWDKIGYKKYPKFYHKKKNDENAVVGKAFISDKPIEKESIRDILYLLEYAQYLELTRATEAGAEVFVINLLDKGKNFERDERDRKKSIITIIVRTVALAVLSFVVGLVLKLIFY